MTNNASSINFYSQVVDLLQSARSKVVRTVNQTMVLTYFEIGRMLIEEEQGGKERAEYGKQVVKKLSEVLTKEFGKGFSERNIEQMRRFYLAYSIPQTASAKSASQTTSWELKQDEFVLSWSHYLKLIRIDDENERKFYEIESV